MSKGFYDHFHPDERAFVDRSMEWIDRADQFHEMKRTDFLDPRQQFIVESLASRSSNVKIRFDGGNPQAERKRAVLVPDYRDPQSVDIGITVMAVSSGDGKFLELDHGDYMGSILGIGIKRDKIGDIHVLDSGCHCLVASEISDFLRLNLNQVHRSGVHVDLLPLDRLVVSEERLEDHQLSVASMRMDGIISDVYRLSRAKVLDPIKAGRCRVNWKVEDDPSKLLKDGDMISMRGFGRFRVIEVEGITKKGRIRVKVGKYL